MLSSAPCAGVVFVKGYLFLRLEGQPGRRSPGTRALSDYPETTTWNDFLRPLGLHQTLGVARPRGMVLQDGAPWKPILGTLTGGFCSPRCPVHVHALSRIPGFRTSPRWVRGAIPADAWKRPLPQPVTESAFTPSHGRADAEPLRALFCEPFLSFLNYGKSNRKCAV